MGFAFRAAVAGTIAAAALLGFSPPEEPEFDIDSLSVESLYAPHGSPQEGFTTPWLDDPKTAWGLIRWLLFTPNPYGPSDPDSVPRVSNDGASLRRFAEIPEITWVGHSTFAIHEGWTVVLTDPHFGPRALLPPRLVPPGIPLDAVPRDAVALISHNHYDHLDAHTVDALPPSVTWFVPLGLADWMLDRDRPNVVELDWWESASHGDWTYTCLPSQHWSRRIEQGTNRSLWCTWLIESPEHRYFFGGDTGYFHGFREFGRVFEGIDVALLPIGAYEPRWFMKYQHMDPEEAVRAYEDLGARTMLGMHWGTFDLTDEPVQLPPDVLREVVERRGADPEKVRSPAVGERWTVPPREDS